MRALIGLSAVLAVIVVGCGDDGSTQSRSELDPPTGAKLSGQLGQGGDVGTLKDAHILEALDTELRDASSLAARITYISASGVTDERVAVTGAVFVPRGTPPQGGWPVVAIGHSTTGIQPECAPSLSRDLLGLSPTVAGFLGAGFAVTVPDYQGLGSAESHHPYLDSTTVGHNLIDSVRAARKLVRELSSRWVAVGAEQGGQAAWAANELAPVSGGALELLGSISVAPITDLDALPDAAAAGQLTVEQKLMLISYLSALEDDYADFDVDRYRRGSARQQWDGLLKCRRSEMRDRDQLAEQIGPDDLRPADLAAVETLRGFTRRTSLPQGVPSKPAWVVYGGQDPLSPPAWTDVALRKACESGAQIQIQFQPEDRVQTIDLPIVLPWITARLNNEPLLNNCPAFLDGTRGEPEATESPAEEEVTETPTEEQADEVPTVIQNTEAPTVPG